MPCCFDLIVNTLLQPLDRLEHFLPKTEKSSNPCLLGEMKQVERAKGRVFKVSIEKKRKSIRGNCHL